MLSIIILTHNNQKSIKKTIESALFADNIIIIDDFSNDNTLNIINKLNTKNKIKIYQRKLNNNFANQRNFGLTKIKKGWVMYLDSDEYITPELQSEILTSIHKTNYNGIYLKRSDLFLGKRLKYGETANIKLLRLAKYNSGKWQNKVHEIWNVKGTTTILSNMIIHHREITISEFLQKINIYSTIKSKELYAQDIKEGFWKIFAYPKAKFIYNFFYKRGFLDGFPGFIIAFMMSWHSLLVRIKLRLLYMTSK